MQTAVVHLVWAPLGVALVEQFAAAYRAQPAGLEHRLAVIYNGFEGHDDPRLAAAQRALPGIVDDAIITPQPLPDLSAYRHAAGELEADALCFLNSYSRPLAADWLAMLAAPLGAPAVGMTGSSGSCESALTSAPFWLRRRRGASFEPFPNPHLRSNGFLLRRELLMDLEWPALASKAAAWALESGKRSISRQIWERDLEVLVVGRDGTAYAPEHWRESATFRAGDQANLLIEDNRTRQYAEAAPSRQRELERMAWGDQSDVSMPAWVAPARRVRRR